MIDNKHLNVINTLIETNDPKYNLEKCVEECLELAEVLMKRILKEKGPKNPTNQSIIEEIGDVAIRIKILSKIFGEDKIEERIDKKLAQYEGYLNEGLYKGGI